MCEPWRRPYPVSVDAVKGGASWLIPLACRSSPDSRQGWRLGIWAARRCLGHANYRPQAR